MAHYVEKPHEKYDYQQLPQMTSFRVVELLRGHHDDPVVCKVHICDWDNPLKYEAVSYAWGDPNSRARVAIDGKVIEVTKSLYSGLTHLRYTDRERFLWADALCINQDDIPERGLQVKQMRKIYEEADGVLIWLGPDSPEGDAKASIDAIVTVSAFICGTLGIPSSQLASIEDIYQDIIFKNRNQLPYPNETPFSSDSLWKSLVWFYSHPYFTRVWVIQELSANKNRSLHCGHHQIDWDQVELVAGYITMETAFSQAYGFSSAHCWWVSTAGGELVKRPSQWLFLLYLASNLAATDARDTIYGLRGLMKLEAGAELLQPDYNKSTAEVYRDCVEAALINFETTDVLLENFILDVTGIAVDTIKVVQPYNERYFGNTALESEAGKKELKRAWQRLMNAISGVHTALLPFNRETLVKLAVSLSYGLNEHTEVESDQVLLINLVAYLKIVLDEETYEKYIPPTVTDEAKDVDGHAFGKPVWDFTYPESSLFITESGLIGSCVSSTRTGDILIAPLGSTYPSVLRPEGGHFTIRGFAFVHGIMRGEIAKNSRRAFSIR